MKGFLSWINSAVALVCLYIKSRVFSPQHDIERRAALHQSAVPTHNLARKEIYFVKNVRCGD